MIKKVFILLLLLFIIVYLSLSVTIFNRPNPDLICTDIELSIKDSEHGDFINAEEIFGILKRNKLFPLEEKLSKISVSKIEDQLKKHPLIDHIDAYKTPSGKIGIRIYQRVPKIRIDSNNGAYLIDNKRGIMPPNTRCAADLPIATGNITKELAQHGLYDFINYLEEDSFWKNQISQVHVVKESRIELIPRVGDHTIILGDLNNYEDKLNRVRTFYNKVLNEIGWNKYKTINVEIDNQIICTKK